MARGKRNKPAKATKAAEKSKKTQSKKKSYSGQNQQNSIKCEECSQAFSKKSNLTTHIKSKHMGKRWVCPFCERDQSSKFSHIRHVKKCKERKKRDYDPDENAYLMLHHTDLTPESKTVLVNNLLKKDAIKNKCIDDLNKELFLAYKYIIGLKKQLSLDSKPEEERVSRLVKERSETQAEESVVLEVPNSKKNVQGECI